VVNVIALQMLPLKLFSRKLSFSHLILFSAGILYGSGIASWGATLGITASIGIAILIKLRINKLANGLFSILSEGFISFGINTFSIVLTLVVFGLGSGISSMSFNLSSDWQSILTAGIFFGILHGGLFATSNLLENQNGIRGLNWDLLTLISIEILPVFFGFISLLIFPFLGDGTIISIGVAVFAITLMVYYLSAPRKILERRLQELSALEQISRILRVEINLDNLLNSIQAQVTDLLKVDNFYVALLDPIDQHIWYPLAVKNGERQNWQRRALTNRLTDRVIRDGKPILIPSEGGKQLSAIGLPVGENAPNAWIGVPLITSEQTIGCLALFSMSPEMKFTEDDLNLLTILSGQTSVAIEIALHNALLSSDITIGRDRLTTILNSVQEGLILFDTDNKISMVNEVVTTITGIPQSDFLGQSYPGLTPELRDAIGLAPEDLNYHLKEIADEDYKIFEKCVYKLKRPTGELFVERSLIRVLD
jgi:PAS domain-containing protein